MEENEKPFGCMTEGCNMRFTNEDHLTVHKKKHDMILNLGNGQKMNIFVADQTPTPTRFIRNCEEVGLFQDLQNVNPFEETFRKAVEAGKSGLALHDGDSLHVPSGGDDTLHTPHVFPFPQMHEEPHSYKSNSISSQEAEKNKNSSDDLLQSSSSDCSNGAIQSTEMFNKSSSSNVSVSIEVPNINSSLRVSTFSQKSDSKVPEKVVSKETVNVEGKSMQLYLRMPDGKLVHLVQENASKPVPTPPVHIPSPENGLALAKLKLKQALKKSGRIPHMEPEMDDRIRVDRHAPPTSSISRVLPTSGGSSHGSGSGDDEDEKKLKFRERNRAAAMRCREKRKTWVQELERRAEEMQATNQHLQSEVTSLRAEVAQLKTLLLAHKNCPITQAMNQAQIVNESSVPISTIQHSLVPISQRVKTIHMSVPSTSRPNSFMVLKKPSKAKRTNLGESSAKRKWLDKPAMSSSSTAPNKPIAPAQPVLVSTKPGEELRTGKIFHQVNGSVTSMPVRTMNVTGSSVVVANPIITVSQSMNDPKLLIPLPRRSVHPPPLITFNNSTACASNENNLNLEKIMNNRRYENVDESVSGSSACNAITIDGSESKVIKLNPNAIRFNSNKRHEEKNAQKRLIEIVKSNDDDMEMMVYADDESIGNS